MNQAKSSFAGPSFRSPAFLRIAGVVSLSALLATCGGDDPSGPSMPAVGSLAFSAVFPSGQFAGANLTIDAVHAVVVRPPKDTLREIIQAFDPGVDQLQLKLSALLLKSTAESLDVTLDLLSGSQRLFTGTSRMEARAGSTPTPTPPTVPLIFVGPGAQLTQLALAPLDSTLTEGDSLPMRVTGTDAGQLPVPAFYVSWSSSDTNVARVNGAGVVHGRVPRGTVYVRARTPPSLVLPQGVVESTTVLLLPVPASLVKVSGDNQAAAVSTRLPLPLAVEVRAADNLPVPGVTVTFAAATGGGQVDSATATSDANGVARSGATLGSGLGAQTFTASAAGAGSVTFGANASVTPSPTWTGIASTDWNNPANWSTGSVPGPTDSVTIPAIATNQPALTALATVGALFNDGTISQNTFALHVAGNLRGSGTITGAANLVFLAPGTIIDHSAIPNLVVQGTAATLGRNLAISGDLLLTGAGANLTLGSHTVVVSGNLDLSLGATLTMNAALDTLRVAGSASFDGGSTSGLLTAGVSFFGGNFDQGATSSQQSYAPSGSHLDVFNGAGTQFIHFTTPGATQSVFRIIVIANPAGGVNLTSSLFQTGPVAFATGVPRIVHGNGGTVFVSELLANNVTLDNVLISANNVQITQFDSITFTNYSPLATPLTILHPGAATPFTFLDLVFSVVPSTGHYMTVVDNQADANTLTINMVNPTPGTPAGFVQTTNGAVVVWPAVPSPVRTWTGAVSNNWSTAGNWNPAIVPTNADDVIIPAGALPSPGVITSCSAKSITVNAGATLDLNGVNCQVQGNVFADGTITGTGSVQMQAAGRVRGDLPGLIVSAPVIVDALTNISGSLTITGVGSILRLLGQQVNVSGNMSVQGAGLLEMTNGADVLTVSGAAVFDGGNELTHLSAGVLMLGGAFNQNGTSSGDSFHPSGTHLTILTAASTTVGFATPGDVPGTSHFQELQWMGGGTLTLQSNVFAHGAFTVAGGTIAQSGGSPALSVGSLVSSSALTFNTVQLTINQPAGLPLVLNNLTFIGTPGNLTALTVNHPGTGGPFTFTNLAFNSVPSTGHYLAATDLNANDGQSLTINMVNPTPATPGAFVSVSNGAVVNWPSGVGSVIWTGAVSNDWFVAGNWSGNAVPTNTDAVVIGAGTPNQPVALTALASAGALTVDGFLDLGGFDLTVFGNVTGAAGGGVLNTGGVANLVMPTGGSTLSLTTVPSLRFNGGMITLTGDVISSGDVAVTGNGGFDLGGHSMSVGGNLSVIGAGALLIMTSQTSIINVIGTVTFDGADETNNLTHGVLGVGGDFSVLGTNSPTAYQSTGLHTTLFVNASGPQNISMVNAAIPGNHFGNVVLNIGGDYTLVGTPLVIEGTFNSGGGGTVLNGNGFPVTASTTDIQGLTLNDAPLQVISSTSLPVLLLDNVTFQSMNPGVTQLEIDLPGQATPYQFNNLTFSTTPTSGQYLLANDNTSDANVLQINVVNPTPSTPGAFVSASGGAVVTWPAAAPAPIWTGTSSSLWDDPANWSTNQVPGPGDNVTIPNGTPNQPVLSGAGANVHDLDIQAGATLDNPDFIFNVNGDLTGGGTATGVGPTMTGSGAILSLAQLNDITITGSVLLGGNIGVTQGMNIYSTGAALDMNGHSVTLGGDLFVGTGGLLRMTSSAETMIVNGNAYFDGGDETGLLTNGNLNVRGDFTQANSTNQNSFAASGNHTVVLDGTIAQAVSMSDSTLSHFHNLLITNTVGVTANNILTVQGALTLAAGAQVTASDVSFTGGGFNVLGTVFTGTGSLLQTGRLYVGSTLTVNGTFNQTSVIFTGSGQTAPSTLPYDFLYVNGTVTFAAGPVGMNTLTVQGGSLTLGGTTTVGGGGVFITAGTLKPNNHTLTTSGNLNTSATGTLTMQNALDSVLVSGAAFFGGGSTLGTLTAGVLKVSSNFVQTAGTSTTSFAASGTHKTLLGSPAVKIVNFATPGTGAGGSHFANLDISAGTGGLNLSSDIVADGALISQPVGAAPSINGGGKRVRAMSLAIFAATTSLILDNAPLLVDEQGTGRSQQFDRAVFQGFPTGTNTSVLLDVTAVGTGATQRQVQFNNTILQTSLGTGGLYARITSSNGLGLRLVMNASNDPTGGFSRSQALNGAQIQYQ